MNHILSMIQGATRMAEEDRGSQMWIAKQMRGRFENIDKQDNYMQLASFCVTYDACTHRLSPHLLKHIQWNVCEQGTVTKPVAEASILSRHTGQVGNSYTEDAFAVPRLKVRETASSVSISTDFTRTTLHVSG